METEKDEEIQSRVYCRNVSSRTEKERHGKPREDVEFHRLGKERKHRERESGFQMKKNRPANC